MRSSSQKLGGGYTDSWLNKLSRNRPFRNGFSVWAAWESERTSFGKTFRKQISYPRFLPLFFCSDHYVDMLTSFRENEANPTYPLYFSWNREKCLKLRSLYGVNAVHVQHPWIPYRRKKYKYRNHDAKGTLVFWPHSSEQLTVQIDMERVEEQLSRIPEKYEPLSICISAHDVQLGLLPKIRRLNYPIFTVGNLQDQRFVDRFYQLVNNFKYSAGFYPGSHIYYLHEFGIPYLALDYSHVTMTSHGNPAFVDGKIDLLAKDYPDSIQRKAFEDWYKKMQDYSDEVTSDQMAFALEQLGCNSSTTRAEMRDLAYSALLENVLTTPKLYARYIWRKVITSRGN